ncbi:MAG: endonuclease [Parcubacteria group bacterium CG_4_9_14_0_2_um_filter_35_11]|nr:MAG: endonuclease [Parcubacteria group bacterium CG07_land_8_20_14_0_80_35_11]PJC47834.1 MAG: endonuclease [Parcubacteria group bacterium CG_4_9_14_0_2_um_filter_35_11]
MYTVYIIQSVQDNSYYIGQTKNLEKRMAEHNRGLNRSTKSRGPWKLVYQREFSTRKESYKEEQRLKSFKKRSSLERIIHSGVEK